MRLDKFLADMGLGTRSQVKQAIRKGQVQVNHQVERQPERKISETEDLVEYQGQSILYEKYVYYMLHKPMGCVSATTDNLHKTVLDYVENPLKRSLFPVGRLDLDTEGLLLITDDGELAHELLSPSHHVEKTYFARINGPVTQIESDAFAQGVDIGEEQFTAPAKLIIHSSGATSEIELTITEGKFHQVKRMFQAVGLEVTYLKRLSMGTLTLDPELPPGAYRPLTIEEQQQLKTY